MTKSGAFGVGCFHFGWGRASPPFSLSTEEYIDAVKDALSSIPSIRDIKVEYAELFSNELRIESEPTTLQDGDYFPRVEFLNVEFDLTIPYRVQQDLFPGEPAPRTSTEAFSVLMKHTFSGPLAFIASSDPNETCSPSDGVRLLREYLRKEFAKMHGPITFEVLGPSPFHANFFYRLIEDAEAELTVTKKNRRGYSDVIFEYGENDVISNPHALVYNELERELGLYYEIQRISVKLMRDESELAEQHQQLRALVHSGYGFLNIAARMRVHTLAQSLISALYEYEAKFATAETEIKRSIESVYENGMDAYLEKFLRGQADQLPSFPATAVRHWVEHLESSSFKNAEIAAVILSALAGGLIGSLMTFALSATINGAGTP